MSDNGSAVVSALGYERLEPGFESRRPESDFSSTHQITEEKSAVPQLWHLQPLATITPDEAQQVQLSRTTNTTSNWWSRRDRQRNRGMTVVALPRDFHHRESKTMQAGHTATTNTERPFHLQQTWTPPLRSTRKAGDRIRDDDQAKSDVAIAKFMGITTSTSY